MRRFKVKRITGTMESATDWMNRNLTKDTTTIHLIHIVSNNHIVISYSEEVDQSEVKKWEGEDVSDL